MKRRAPTIWAAVVVLGIAGLAYLDGNSRKAAAPKAEAPATVPAPAPSDEAAPEGESAPAPLVGTGAPEVPGPTTRFHMMPDGSPVPALAPSAPERIKLGVAIFRYKGTQGSSDSSRSREAALALAQEATKVGQEDFANAVKKGDRGSSENIGWIDQRILERAVEYAVFSLEKGEISKAPIDTPRGFWVAKRLR
jgi:hypothetical protein